jgi:hypothetical protein
MSDHTELDSFIESLRIKYAATFIPQSVSRNAGEKQKSLNWRVSLERNGRALATDYMQGIGHVPGYRQAFGRLSLAQAEVKRAQEAAAESGKYPRVDSRGELHSFLPGKPLPAPLLRDVLYSLVLDSDVLDSAGFESWAGEFGYDTDSRKAEATYRACVEIALQLRALLGGETINKLRELFQGY